MSVLKQLLLIVVSTHGQSHCPLGFNEDSLPPPPTFLILKEYTTVNYRWNLHHQLNDRLSPLESSRKLKKKTTGLCHRLL